MTCRVERQRGVALIIAMLVFALATTLMVAMSAEFNLFLRRAGNSYIAEQATAYLRGGEELAGMILRQDLREDQQEKTIRDDLSEQWSQQLPPYALDEGGWLVGRLEDLQGRFNLNSVAGKAPDGRRFTAAQEQFVRLLMTPEEPAVSEQDAILITEALMDWLDVDREPREFGAEDDYYYDMTPSYRAANSNLLSVSELRLVAYMTPEIFGAIAPYLTVWGDPGKINIHTAPAAVLRSINSTGQLQPLSVGEAEQLLEMRGEEGFESVQALLDSPVFAGRELDAEVQARLGETSSVFLYMGEVEVADRVARLYSVLLREDSVVKAIQRSSSRI